MPEEPQAIPPTSLLDEAIAVLDGNNKGHYTAPAPYLYPHQWLWDSCFIAIGLSHIDTHRAQAEVDSLFQGQWLNGMMPNIIFDSSPEYKRDRNLWRTWVNPYSPDHVSTSGMTQPPMLAEAVVRIGKKLKAAERRSWYKYAYPKVLAYHQWLYQDRDPHNEGLVLLLHPWETGLDNTPVWMDELHEHQLPLWIQALNKTKLVNLLSLIRRDTKHVPPAQRMSNLDSLALFDVHMRMRRKGYNTHKILDRSHFAIEDLTFNSILIRANELLVEIATFIKEDIPEDLHDSMQKTRKQLGVLWDPYAGEFFSLDFMNHELLKTSSIATLMPLYAGSITHEQAKQLVSKLENEHWLGPAYPVPSVPINSPWFNEQCYWQGPSWVNMNWLIIDGLKRYGFDDHAAALAESTLEMVEKAGFYEYFNPLTGEGEGIENFSWTAALTIDLLQKH